jgi:hypothetical protein
MEFTMSKKPKWEYRLEAKDDAGSSLTDFENMFASKGNDGWEYVGVVPGPSGVALMVWKRSKD